MLHSFSLAPGMYHDGVMPITMRHARCIIGCYTAEKERAEIRANRVDLDALRNFFSFELRKGKALDKNALTHFCDNLCSFFEIIG